MEGLIDAADQLLRATQELEDSERALKMATMNREAQGQYYAKIYHARHQHQTRKARLEKLDDAHELFKSSQRVEEEERDHYDRAIRELEEAKSNMAIVLRRARREWTKEG